MPSAEPFNRAFQEVFIYLINITHTRVYILLFVYSYRTLMLLYPDYRVYPAIIFISEKLFWSLSYQELFTKKLLKKKKHTRNSHIYYYYYNYFLVNHQHQQSTNFTHNLWAYTMFWILLNQGLGLLHPIIVRFSVSNMFFFFFFTLLILLIIIIIIMDSMQTSRLYYVLQGCLKSSPRAKWYRW